MHGHAEARVELRAIAGNVEALAGYVEPSAVMAVVKADGYGHGLVPVARAAVAGGASWLGVVHCAEALALRDAGIKAPVLCMMALPSDERTAAIEAEVDLTAGSADMVRQIADAAMGARRVAKVQLKADTGLSRGGATAGDWPELVTAALEARAAGLLEVTALWSHFASADEPGDPSVEKQLAAFGDACDQAMKAGLDGGIRHMANTAAGITLPQARLDLVRFGGAIYGLSTLPGGAPGWLRGAMTLRSALIQVKRVPAGTGVSYGHRYVTERETTLGLVPLGYADGVPRRARGKPLVWARGRRWQVAGTVCMDQFVVDFGDEPVEVGDEVVLFGPGDAGEPTAHQWGNQLGTISYEIVTGIGERVRRVYG